MAKSQKSILAGGVTVPFRADTSELKAGLDESRRLADQATRQLQVTGSVSIDTRQLEAQVQQTEQRLRKAVAVASGPATVAVKGATDLGGGAALALREGNVASHAKLLQARAQRAAERDIIDREARAQLTAQGVDLSAIGPSRAERQQLAQRRQEERQREMQARQREQLLSQIAAEERRIDDDDRRLQEKTHRDRRQQRLAVRDRLVGEREGYFDSVRDGRLSLPQSESQATARARMRGGMAPTPTAAPGGGLSLSGMIAGLGAVFVVNAAAAVASGSRQSMEISNAARTQSSWLAAEGAELRRAGLDSAAADQGARATAIEANAQKTQAWVNAFDKVTFGAVGLADAMLGLTETTRKHAAEQKAAAVAIAAATSEARMLAVRNAEYDEDGRRRGALPILLARQKAEMEDFESRAAKAIAESGNSLQVMAKWNNNRFSLFRAQTHQFTAAARENNAGQDVLIGAADNAELRLTQITAENEGEGRKALVLRLGTERRRMLDEQKLELATATKDKVDHIRRRQQAELAGFDKQAGYTLRDATEARHEAGLFGVTEAGGGFRDPKVDLMQQAVRLLELIHQASDGRNPFSRGN